MSVLAWVILFTALGGALSALSAGVFLLLPQTLRSRLLAPLISFAVGALLGAAFLALLPHALEEAASDTNGILVTVLFGLLLFFLLEKIVLWHHHHGEHPGAHASPAAYLILIGDGIHNFVDGILVASAFLTDVHLGIVISVAVVAHEIPQELGDFVVLLNGGFSRGKALLYNVLSSLTMVVGGVLAYFTLAGTLEIVPYMLALAAASFIYIAVADLIPGLHVHAGARISLQQVVLILAGVAVIFLADAATH